MNRFRVIMFGIVMAGFSLATNGCHEWSHWDRHGYDSDQTRYDRNDRGGFRDGPEERHFAR
jgi:hypothetical protein